MNGPMRKIAQPFAPHNLDYSLKEIGIRIKSVVAAFQDESVKIALGRIGVFLTETGPDNSFLLFNTPLGDIKVEFEKRLDGEYLGVAAIFVYVNKKIENEEPFFVLFMNLGAKWMDSSGFEFSTGGQFEVPQNYEFVPLMMRVLTKRLQIQDAKLLAIKS